jgi:phosphomannomutase
MLLEALGCEVLVLNGEPDGRFAHGLEPVAENLDQLARATADAGADAGFAQDPDADRLAIVDERGQCLGEEYTLVLAAWMMLKRHGPGPIVVNLSTSRMIDDLGRRFPGTSVHRTAVGEANVAMEMRARGARVGGEGNGGVILPEVVLIRDSLGAMAQVLALCASEGKPLSALAAALPRYEMIKHRFEIRPGAQSAEAMERVAARFRGARLDTRDGVRIDLDEGWVHLRPSNTEPIIRLIAEARTRERAMGLIEEVAKAAGLQEEATKRRSDEAT